MTDRVHERDATRAMTAPLKIGSPGGLDIPSRLRPTVSSLLVVVGVVAAGVAFYVYAGRRLPPFSWVPGPLFVVGVIAAAFAAGAAARRVKVDGRAGARHARSALVRRASGVRPGVWVVHGRPVPAGRRWRRHRAEVPARELAGR